MRCICYCTTIETFLFDLAIQIYVKVFQKLRGFANLDKKLIRKEGGIARDDNAKRFHPSQYPMRIRSIINVCQPAGTLPAGNHLLELV